MRVKNIYRLDFGKIRSKEFSDTYSCGYNLSIEGSFELGTLLSILSNLESKFFLEELNKAISGVHFEEDYVPDFSTDVWVDFKPPIAVISDTFSIDLLELKELMEDWILFMNK